MIEDTRLPPVSGGWRRQTIDVGWRQIDLALPSDPDALLADATVLEANRQDDYMPYWASLWPAASEMAAALAGAPWPAGTRVLEVGCGLGLVGIAGLLRGWDVLLTDYEPQALLAVEVNAELNGCNEVRTARLDWRQPTGERFPVILACDVLYEIRNHAPLLSFLEGTLMPDGCCWIGDPGRTPIVEFYHAAVDAGWRISVQNARGETAAFPVRGQFQVLVVHPTLTDKHERSTAFSDQ